VLHCSTKEIEMIALILAVQILGMFGLSVAALVGMMFADYIRLQRRHKVEKANLSRLAAQQASDAQEPVAV
jgi:hypothetical protein